MTTVVAWEREFGRQSELIMASDSRFGGGERWDACAKIFDIGRSDALLAFSGDTKRALPLIFQILATTRSFQGSLLRTLDVPKFAHHLVNVLNAVLAKAEGAAALEKPDCKLLLGGWSWSLGRFVIYRYTFDKRNWQFIVSGVTRAPRAIQAEGRVRICAVIGDGGRDFTGRLARDFNRRIISGRLGYHPLEALYQQTIDPALDSVGGPLQVAKVYRSIRVEHFATRIDGDLYVSGRPVLSYENVDLRAIVRNDNGTWTIDPQGAVPR
ncbi:hypothetical protein [Mycobacterium paraense]|uniref:hypothetical protein n=1 Tax=Mycobacterium paraense TaxID=767916 RepID=UPI001150E629|nr:hypothetical protein [Mycobacterium paraense]